MTSTTSSAGAPRAPKVASAPLDFLDQRLGLAKAGKSFLKKVFPDHWSFLLGEIALFSFIIILLSGTFLTLWFEPSMKEVVYEGSYTPLYGTEMSAAFESTLGISFDVRGGLLMRQIHHWSAHIFIASMMVHALRNFFTGSFRKPRELNWILGSILLQLGILAGFTGYSLPDDLLSGTGLRIAEGIARSVPVIGTYASFFLFGGEFPGDDIIARLYPVHILLIPGLILALIAAHIGLVILNKHTQFAGAGKTNRNVIGQPFFPNYMAKQGGFFFITFGVIALLGAFFQVNPVWSYGAYRPEQVGAGAQPDWYMGWLEGALRIMPNWETEIFGFSISWNVFIPGGVLLGSLPVIMIVYPFLEAWITGDKREHHVLDRPRDRPTRTGLGVAFMTFYGLLWLGGGNDIIAITFNLSLNSITWFLRIMVFVGPVIAFIVTRRICVALQRKDAEEVLHGRETGIIQRLPSGEYIEVHEPLSQEREYALTARERTQVLPAEPEVDENGVPERSGPLRKVRARLSRFYFGRDEQKPTRAELEADHHPAELESPDGEHSELESTRSSGH